jgi:hypothetical protein
LAKTGRRGSNNETYVLGSICLLIIKTHHQSI